MESAEKIETQVTPHVSTVETPVVKETPKESVASVTEDKKEVATVTENNPETKYELKLPDGASLDEAHVEKVISLAKAKGLTNEQAQEILNHDAELVTHQKTKFQEEMKETIEAAKTQWLEAVKTDKEVGGDKFNETVSAAAGVVNKFGSEELKRHLNESGLGNHPELVKFCAKIAKAIGPDTLVKASAAPQVKKSVSEIFYGKTN